MKLMLLCAGLLCSVLLILGATQTAPAPTIPLPARENLSVDEIFKQLGQCDINLAAEQKYVQKLVARIRQLEAAAKLPPELPKPEKP